MKRKKIFMIVFAITITVTVLITLLVVTTVMNAIETLDYVFNSLKYDKKSYSELYPYATEEICQQLDFYPSENISKVIEFSHTWEIPLIKRFGLKTIKFVKPVKIDESFADGSEYHIDTKFEIELTYCNNSWIIKTVKRL